MSKITDATKQMEEATREITREQDAWRTKLADSQRTNLKLMTSNRALETKNKTLQEKADKLQRQLESDTELVRSLGEQADELETKRADKALELADVLAEVEKRKSTIDTELDAYATERKKQIRDDILLTNEELVGNRAELATLRQEADDKRAELAGLNQVALQEQEDQKIAKSMVDGDLEANKLELDEVQRDIEAARESLQKLFYERDNAQLTIAKAKEEHDKFLSYESKARKILDAKDRELVERSGDIAHENQLLKNKRTFLPEL